MPIKSLQQMQRLPRLGKIRMGYSVPGRNGGKTPKRADAWILTSPHRDLLEKAASLYGGEVQEWDNDGNQEYRLFTTSKEIPVYVTPFEGSQWMELRDGSGNLLRRCDSETCTRYEERDAPGYGKKMHPLPPEACLCDQEAPECKAVSRFEFILKDLPELGVWLLETRSINAALEMPQMMEYSRRAGKLVASAFLVFMIRRRKGKIFPVAQLRLKASPRHLEALGDGSGAPMSLEESNEIPALPAMIAEADAEGYLEKDLLALLAQRGVKAPKGIRWIMALGAPSLDLLDQLLDRCEWTPEGRPTSLLDRLAMAQADGVKTWPEMVLWAEKHGGDPR